MGLEVASGKWTDWGTTDDWKRKKIRPWPGVYQVRSVAADGAPVQLDLCGAFVKGTGKCKARKHMSGLGIEGVVYIGMTVNLYHRFGLLLRSWAANHPKKPHGSRSNWNQSPWLQKTYPLESMEFRCKAIGTRDRNEWNAAAGTANADGAVPQADVMAAIVWPDDAKCHDDPTAAAAIAEENKLLRQYVNYVGALPPLNRDEDEKGERQTASFPNELFGQQYFADLPDTDLPPCED